MHEREPLITTPEQQPEHFDRFPTPEDWDALQGGRPRVFYKPGTQLPWQVVHVYEQHDDPDKRFQAGMVVDTTPPSNPRLLEKYIVRKDYEGNQVHRTVVFPSFMDRTVHGEICETRSGTRSVGGYRRIRSQPEYEDYLAELKSKGFMEIRFSVTNEGFKLLPRKITRSRPLKSQK